MNEDKGLEAVLAQDEPTACALSLSNSIKILTSKEEVPQECAAAVVTDKCTVYILLNEK